MSVHASNQLSDEREVYLFRFSSQKRAEYWRRQTVAKFANEVIEDDFDRHRIVFKDAIYYFWGPYRVGRDVRHATEYTSDELYIILDDPERRRLASFIPTTLDVMK